MQSSRVEVIPDEDESKGKEEMVLFEADEEPAIPEKTFLERVSDLVFALKSIEGYNSHAGLEAFETVVSTIGKKTGEQRRNLEDGLKDVFEKFYRDNRQSLVKENLEFLTRDGQKIVFGKSGKANIPLSEIYIDTQENNPEMIDTIDASLYFVIQHVCSEEDLDPIIDICKQYEPDRNESGGNFLSFIGNIVGRVSTKLGGDNAAKLETEDGGINTNAVGSVVQDLISDPEITNSLKNMMGNISSENFDINEVVQGLFKMTGNK